MKHCEIEGAKERILREYGDSVYFEKNKPGRIECRIEIREGCLYNLHALTSLIREMGYYIFFDNGKIVIH